MTCPFCGKPDDAFGANHFERHKVEYLRDLNKWLESISTTLENILYELERANKGKVQ